MSGRATTISEHSHDEVAELAGSIQRALSGWFPASTHPGGFAWEVATEQLPPAVAVAQQGDLVVGWAGYSPKDARVECEADDIATTETLVDWLMRTAGHQPVSVAAHRQQHYLRRLLTSYGFTEGSTAIPGLMHPACDVAATVPAGYRIRPVDPSEGAERVEVHRRAWKPARLPFTDADMRSGIDPAAESRFNEQRFAAMQTAQLYERDLDLVIEAPDGSLAGCCTVWLDPASGWAELEPLGVVPEHRRRGLAQALVLDVCRRVDERGGRQVFINSAPLPYYLAPWKAYVKAGFTPMDRGMHLVRPAP